MPPEPCSTLDVLCKAPGYLNWSDPVLVWLQPWEGGIDSELLDQTEQSMRTFDPARSQPPRENPTPYVDIKESQWRVQVVDGRLYVTAINLYHHMKQYGASALLAIFNTLKRYGKGMPNIDILLNNYDEPVVAGRDKYQERDKNQGGTRLPPIILSPAPGRYTQDVPFVDYSFYYPLVPHPLRTLRWDAERRVIQAAASAVPWEARESVAAWSGNIDQYSTRFLDRRLLAELASRHPADFFVNHVNVVTRRELGDCLDPKLQGAAHRADLGQLRGLWRRGCDMPFATLCSGFKYLVHVGGNTYSNRLKQLLLCGSPVIVVSDYGGHQEFYQAALVAGVHYIHVSSVHEVLGAVHLLRQSDDWARSIGTAGQRQMRRMDEASVEAFVLTLAQRYNALQRFTPRPHRLSVRINCEDDIWHLVRMDGTDGSSAWAAQNFSTGVPARCLAPRLGPLVPPGSGQWALQPGYDPRGWPRFFMPKEQDSQFDSYAKMF